MLLNPNLIESEEDLRTSEVLVSGEETEEYYHSLPGRGTENEEHTITLDQEGPREDAGVGGATNLSPKNRVRGLWRSAANRTIRKTVSESSETLPGTRKGDSNLKRSVTGGVGDNYHQVWTPRKQPRLADLVASLGNLHERQKQERGLLHPPVSPTTANPSLRSRQQMLQDRIQVTQAVLTEEILGDERAKKPRMTFKEASKLITKNLQKQQREKNGCKSLSDVVTLYLAKKKAEERSKAASPVPIAVGGNTIPRSYQTHHGKARLKKRRSTRGAFDTGTLGVIPLEKWHKLVWESKTSVSTFEGGYKLETEL